MRPGWVARTVSQADGSKHKNERHLISACSTNQQKLTEQADRPMACLPCSVLVPLNCSAPGRGTQSVAVVSGSSVSSPQWPPHHCLTLPSDCRKPASNINAGLFHTRLAEKGNRQPCPYMYRMSARPWQPKHDPELSRLFPVQKPVGFDDSFSFSTSAQCRALILLASRHTCRHGVVSQHQHCHCVCCVYSATHYCGSSQVLGPRR